MKLRSEEDRSQEHGEKRCFVTGTAHVFTMTELRWEWLRGQEKTNFHGTAPEREWRGESWETGFPQILYWYMV